MTLLYGFSGGDHGPTAVPTWGRATHLGYARTVARQSKPSGHEDQRVGGLCLHRDQQHKRVGPLTSRPNCDTQESHPTLTAMVKPAPYVTIMRDMRAGR